MPRSRVMPGIVVGAVLGLGVAGVLTVSGGGSEVKARPSAANIKFDAPRSILDVQEPEQAVTPAAEQTKPQSKPKKKAKPKRKARSSRKHRKSRHKRRHVKRRKARVATRRPVFVAPPPPPPPAYVAPRRPVYVAPRPRPTPPPPAPRPRPRPTPPSPPPATFDDSG